MSNNIKPFRTNDFLRPLKNTGMFLMREATEAAKNDPALAMRLTAGGLVSPIMSGVNPEVAVTTEATIVPIVRAGLLALNTVRAVSTFKNPDSTLLEKGLDVARVISDTAGLIGGLAMLFTPQYAALGAKLMGTAYSVDIVSHASRTLTHAAGRVKIWQAEANASKPDDNGPRTPGPNPPPKDPPPSPGPSVGPNKTLAVLESPKQLSLWNN